MQSRVPTTKQSRRIPPIIGLIAAILLCACASAAIPSSSETQPPSRQIVTVQASATPSPVKAAQTLPVLEATPTQILPTSAAPSPSGTATVEQVLVRAGKVTVPILLYHHVSDQGKSRYILPIADFRAQMKILAEEGYHTISISQLAEVIRQGGNLPLKPVVITFDDGYLDTYQNAFPILKSYGFQGVAYIITSTLGTKLSYGYMQSDELKALIAAGWEIGSHSISHTELRTSKLGIRNEIEQSRKVLESLLGVPIRTFSYPFGLANPWTEEQVAKYGYDSAVGLDILVNQTPKRLYYLSRREVARDMTISDFQALLVPGKEEAAGLFNDSTPAPVQK